jgi:phosphoglycolate phosphatase
VGHPRRQSDGRRFKFKTVTEDEIAMLRGRTSREIIAIWACPVEGSAGRRPRQEDDGRRGDAIPLFSGTGDLLRGLSASGAAFGDRQLQFRGRPSARSWAPTWPAWSSHYGCGAAIFGKAAKFKAVVKAARIAKDRVLCIGDETRDIEAAREAGLACGAVNGATPPARPGRACPTMMFGAWTKLFRGSPHPITVGAD